MGRSRGCSGLRIDPALGRPAGAAACPEAAASEGASPGAVAADMARGIERWRIEEMR